MYTKKWKPGFCHKYIFIFYFLWFNPRLPKGVPPPLKIIFRPAKTLNFTIKWVQLIVESSFPVILAQKFLLPYTGVGVG